MAWLTKINQHIRCLYSNIVYAQIVTLHNVLILTVDTVRYSGLNLDKQLT